MHFDTNSVRQPGPDIAPASRTMTQKLTITGLSGRRSGAKSVAVATVRVKTESRQSWTSQRRDRLTDNCKLFPQSVRLKQRFDPLNQQDTKQSQPVWCNIRARTYLKIADCSSVQGAIRSRSAVYTE